MLSACAACEQNHATLTRIRATISKTKYVNVCIWVLLVSMFKTATTEGAFEAVVVFFKEESYGHRAGYPS